MPYDDPSLTDRYSADSAIEPCAVHGTGTGTRH